MSERAVRIGIVGGGAMGSIYASLLSGGAHEVWLFDVWREQVEAIRRHGLRVDGPGDRQRVVASINATRSTEDVGCFDLVLVAVKAFHTAEAGVSVGRLLAPDGIVITMQNGIGNGERLAAMLPEARVAIGVPGHGGTLLGPGHVAHRVAAATELGWVRPDAADDPAPIAELLTRAGLETRATRDVRALLWAHIAVVAGVNAIAALCRIPNDAVATVPEAARLSELAVREVVAVATAAGVELPWADPVAATHAIYLANGPAHLSSMTVDVLRERRTEVDVLNGAVVEYGRQLGIPTPVNDALTLAIKTVEQTSQRRAQLKEKSEASST
jgi:2-dehydropantoate 2-reductase